MTLKGGKSDGLTINEPDLKPGNILNVPHWEPPWQTTYDRYMVEEGGVAFLLDSREDRPRGVFNR